MPNPLYTGGCERDLANQRLPATAGARQISSTKGAGSGGTQYGGCHRRTAFAGKRALFIGGERGSAGHGTSKHARGTKTRIIAHCCESAAPARKDSGCSGPKQRGRCILRAVPRHIFPL